MRKKDGTNYPPKTLYLLLTGLLRHMRYRNVTCPNVLDTKDPQFSSFHNSLDNVLRDLRTRAETQQTEAFSKEEETLWRSGVLGSDNLKSLLHAVFIYPQMAFASISKLHLSKSKMYQKC